VSKKLNVSLGVVFCVSGCALDAKLSLEKRQKQKTERIFCKNDPLQQARQRVRKNWCVITVRTLVRKTFPGTQSPKKKRSAVENALSSRWLVFGLFQTTWDSPGKALLPGVRLVLKNPKKCLEV
jgi:hypothetical protein